MFSFTSVYKVPEQRLQPSLRNIYLFVIVLQAHNQMEQYADIIGDYTHISYMYRQKDNEDFYKVK
jgi:hypothetical protein